MLKKYHVPSHIVNHCKTVSKLGVFLAQRLKEKGIKVNVEQVDRACLLHDIARICDIKESDYGSFTRNVSEEDKAKWNQIRQKYYNLGHEDAAYEILKEKYPILALIIKKHRYMTMLSETKRPKSWEEKLVYYADMRVMHDKIVSLKVRLEDGHKRNTRRYETNSNNNVNRNKVDSLIYQLEKEIFEKIGLEPTEITNELIDSYGHNIRDR